VQLAGAGVELAKRPFAGRIPRIGQDLVQGAQTECRTKAGSVAMGVQPFACVFDPKWTRMPITLCIELVNQAERFCFNRINIEPLLYL
jgi:hypothetical protein